ncbi:tRNA pseudouridine55 synthase [Mariprofundus micogutta]|uniref:tRNA pseudouridine synthase B n=1 Tax=Mariprofundus micogutta TaxID=1921010 RepID=A0A1L8CPQ5_9PROT|nr:tRNA pseudouridine(55) synthase TruB [Mariprofundus micogutta]GAV20901.1 tRNA pseudouridine55 synthase [Mariprofundus micogutta]
MTDICGIVFLDKPLGWSSRRAVNEISRLFSEPGQKRIKAGHTGTLDPLATGMLPILLGDATRFAEMGLEAEKSYRVTFDISYQTDTLDLEGETTQSFENQVELQQLEHVLEQFRGDIEQVPPVYSAIRIDGKRAHDMARKGQAVEMKSRAVTIHELKLVSFDYPLVTLEVVCSKGTYIRSLARDIGQSLAMGGCVTQLRRLSTAGWPEAMMVTPEILHEQKQACLLPLGQWLRDYERVELQNADIKRFLHGQRIQLRNTEADNKEMNVAVFAGDMVLGTGLLKAGMRHMVLHPARILPTAQKRYL